MTKGVIFDMDGMLLDTERLAVQTWKEASEEKGFFPSHSLLLSTVGVDVEGTRRILDSAMPGFPYKEVRERRHELIRVAAEQNGVPVRPGAFSLLQRLVSSGVPVGVATSTPAAAAWWLLEKADLHGFITILVGGDQVTAGKPDPEIYFTAAQRLGCLPEHCTVFEDSAAGVRAGLAAGMKVIHIPDLVEIPWDLQQRCYKVYYSLDSVTLQDIRRD